MVGIWNCGSQTKFCTKKRYGCSSEKPGGGGYHVISIFGGLLNNSTVNMFSEK